MKVLDSKSSVVNSHRGFESHPLRHLFCIEVAQVKSCGDGIICSTAILVYRYICISLTAPKDKFLGLLST